MMMPLSLFYYRFAWWILVGLGLCLPVIIFGAVKAVQSNVNKVEDWLPDSFGETRELSWFRQHFASDQFVLVSWPGCRIASPPGTSPVEPADPRMERLAQLLQPDSENAGDSASTETSVGSTSRMGGFVKSVTTGERLLHSLLRSPVQLPYEEAVRRLRGVLIGRDGRQTCVLVTLQPNSVGNLRTILGRPTANSVLGSQRPEGELFTALRLAGIPVEEVRLGGPPVDNVAIDEEGEKTMVRLAGYACLLGLSLAWWSLRSIRLTLIVFFSGMLSAAVAMAIVYFCGQNMDAILLSMPSLVYVLAMSSAVHLVNYYRGAVNEHGLSNAVGIAIKNAWRPALLCSVTTAVGLGSLYFSQLAPIRHFGLYSAVGVIAMFIVTFVCLPALIQVVFLWGVVPQQPVPLEIARLIGIATPRPQIPQTSFDRLWGRAAYMLVKHHALVLLISFILLAVSILGLQRVTTSIDLLKLFADDARLIQDYRWFEAEIGPLVPLEVVIKFPLELSREFQKEDSGDSSRWSFLERLEFVSLCQRALEFRHGEQGASLIGPALSPATFVPILPEPSHRTVSMAKRSVMSDRLWKDRSTLQGSGYYCLDDQNAMELWRISMRAVAFANLDYREFLEDVRETLMPIFHAQHASQALIALAMKKSTATDGEVARLRGTKVVLEQIDGDVAPRSDKQRAFLAALSRTLYRAGLRLQLGWRDDELGKDPSVNESTPSAISFSVRFDGQTLQLYDAKSGLAIETKSAGYSVEPDGLNSRQVSSVFTGVVPIVYKAQRILLTGLISSSVWSFLTITPIMMFVCRGLLAGAVAMIPNTLPVLVVFGGMGWLRIPVDIGSMMAASIALGVAVDDTIHFLSWFRRSLTQTGNRRRAIIAAYRHCANPTLQTALISGLGLSVFAMSTFVPTQRFGCLMLVILISGVIAELFMLPALLASGLGKCFQISRNKNKQRR